MEDYISRDGELFLVLAQYQLHDSNLNVPPTPLLIRDILNRARNVLMDVYSVNANDLIHKEPFQTALGSSFCGPRASDVQNV